MVTVESLCKGLQGLEFCDGADILEQRLGVQPDDAADFGDALVHYYDKKCIELGEDYEDALMRVPEAIKAMVEGAVEWLKTKDSKWA